MTSPRTLLMTGALTPLPDLGSQFSAYAWTESLGTFPLKRLALLVRTVSWQRQTGLTLRTWQSVLDIPSTFAFIAHRALVVLAAPSSGRECIQARQAHATVPRRFMAMGSLLDALAYRGIMQRLPPRQSSGLAIRTWHVASFIGMEQATLTLRSMLNHMEWQSGPRQRQIFMLTSGL